MHDFSETELENASPAEIAMAFDRAGLSRIKWTVLLFGDATLSVSVKWAQRVIGVPLSVEIAGGLDRGLIVFSRVTSDTLHLELSSFSSSVLLKPELLFNLYAPVSSEDGGFVAGVHIHPAASAFRLN